MSIFTIGEIALGLAFVYLLLSLLVSWINEMLSNFFQWRAKDLKAAIRGLLKDPPAFLDNPAQYMAAHPEYVSLVDRFYGHPLVKALTTNMSDKPGPSCIPSRTFALVVFDLLFPEKNLASDQANLEMTIKSKDLDPDLKATLLTLIGVSNRDIESLRSNIETWFNDAMGQTSEWYKRNMKYLSLEIGFALAVGLNVDTLVVADALWQEPTLRANIVSYLEENLPKLEPGQTASSDAALGQIRDALSSFDFPVGWNTYGPGQLMEQAQKDNQSPMVTLLYWIFRRIWGWALTAIAVSQGAPFWFDFLRKMIQPTAPSREVAA